MKTKKVNRYYCDYCKKSGCSAPHMRKHEERCTMNPRRRCGVCGLLEEAQVPLEPLVQVFRKSPAGQLDGPAGSYRYFSDAMAAESNDALADVRVAANNCPACILAAIRQAGIPVRSVTDFDWTKEMEAVWKEFNESQGQAAN